MKKITSLLVLLIAAMTIEAQVPTIAWQNTIGGTGDEGTAVIFESSSGDYIMAGYSSSNIGVDKLENSQGGRDYWIMALDVSGNLLWQNTIGGSDGESLDTVLETGDGGYLIAGTSESRISGDKTEDWRGQDDYWIVKIDALGTIEWDKTLGAGSYDYLRSAALTDDGGYILGGTSYSDAFREKSEDSRGESDYWILKLNATGDVQWDKTIGGSDVESLSKVLQTNDGGYIVAGTSSSPISGEKEEALMGSSDYWILKLNASGAIQWQQAIGGNGADWCRDIIELPNGAFVVGGQSNSNISGDKTDNSKGGFDYWIFRMTAVGNLVWQNTIGANADDGFEVLVPTQDGGYFLGGSSPSNASGDKTENAIGPYDYWVVKTNQHGQLIWEDTIGGINFDFIRGGRGNPIR